MSCVYCCSVGGLFLSTALLPRRFTLHLFGIPRMPRVSLVAITFCLHFLQLEQRIKENNEARMRDNGNQKASKNVLERTRGY